MAFKTIINASENLPLEDLFERYKNIVLEDIDKKLQLGTD